MAIAATKAIEKFSVAKRKKIRTAAHNRFSTDVVALEYQNYFDRLYDLWGDGWYTT